jgi:hypothetical protein
MKQTAVEWFAIQLERIGVTEELIGHLTKEAKEMEKQQSIDACGSMYSEEEVFNFLMNFWMEKRREFKTNPVCVANWFEQFKKK